jgi:hypothetical protein
MSQTSLGNQQLTQNGNVLQEYEVTIVTAGDATTAEGELIFDSAFSAVPKVLNVYVKDTDGTKRVLLSSVFADRLTVSGLYVNLTGLGDTDGPINIDAATFVVTILVRGQV